MDPSTSGGPPGAEPPISSVSTFPAPPMQYIQLYSGENVASGTAPPPPPPIVGPYETFAVLHNTNEEIIPPLSQANIKSVYNQNGEGKSELKQLNRSLMAAFLDLLEILIQCPESAERLKKIEDIKLLFINIHHLINQYRPHQARETLKLMLELQKNERIAIVKRFRQNFTNVRESIRQTIDSLNAKTSLPSDVQAEIDDLILSKRKWDAEHGDDIGGHPGVSDGSTSLSSTATAFNTDQNSAKDSALSRLFDSEFDPENVGYVDDELLLNNEGSNGAGGGDEAEEDDDDEEEGGDDIEDDDDDDDEDDDALTDVLPHSVSASAGGGGGGRAERSGSADHIMDQS